jgi:hypothetical protein
MNQPNKKRLKTLFAGTVPKHSVYPNSNEDRFQVCDERQRYVLCDGAGESYNSMLWAEVLVESWLNAPPRRNLNRWLRDAIARYSARSDVEHLSWSQEAAFTRGSYSTLLAVEPLDDQSIGITAVGDSLALVVFAGAIGLSFPYSRAEQFHARPHLLSTVLSKNMTPFFREAALEMKKGSQSGSCHTRLPFFGREDSFIICVTDAVGEWVLKEENDQSGRLQRLLNIRAANQLAELIDEARTRGEMRRDDSTVIILGEADDGTSANS